MNKTSNGGYVGLLFLIISIAFIALFFWGINSNSTNSEEGQNEESSKGIIEKNLEVLNKTKNLKTILEEKSKQKVEEIEQEF